MSRCIAGSFRTAGLAALEKEAALLPAQLRIGRDALNTVAYYLTLPPTHILRPLLRDAIAAPPKNPKCCSTLHLVERVPGIRWPPTVPARGQRIRTRGTPRLVGALEDPLVEFDSSLGMEPILPVYAAPHCASLSLSPPQFCRRLTPYGLSASRLVTSDAAPRPGSRMALCWMEGRGGRRCALRKGKRRRSW